MKRKGHSFLDLTALPPIGALLLDPRPAWLWAENGRRVLWANAAGVALLGQPSMQAVLQHRFTATDAVAAQIASLAPTTGAGEPLLTVIRFPSGAAADPHLCVCSRLLIDDATDAILIASTQPPLRVEPLLGRALGLAAAVAEDDVAAIVMRPDGRIVAASRDAESMRGDAVLAELAAAVATSGRRMLKRRMRFGTGQRLVGIAAVTTPEGAFALALVGPAEPDEAGAPAEAARGVTAAAPAPAEASVPSSAPAVVASPAAPATPRPIAAATSPTTPQPDATATPAVAPAPVSPAPPAAKAGKPGDSAPSAGPFRFRARSTPVRFVFHIDRDQRFTEVSPELAAVVGPVRADIVGRTFSEVARDFGFANAAAVERALARRDTWSGVTVYWPVQDSADAVAVDLAALPAFTRGGGFEGFRGFGVCRANDVMRQRPGGAIPPVPAKEPPEAANRTAPAIIDAAPPSNIVRLPSAGAPPPVIDLSGNEQDAFRRIAEALRGAQRRPPETPAPGLAPAAAAPTSTAEPAAVAPPPPAVAPLVPLRILDRLPIGLLMVRDRAILFANRALLDRLGYADAAAFAAAGGIDGLFAGEAETPDADAGRRVLLTTASGGKLAVEARLHIVPWTDGPATMLTVRTDDMAAPMSRLELADQRASLARIDELEAVLDTATDGVVVVDADARIMSLNRSAEALFAVEATDVLGRKLTELLAEESRSAALDYLEGLAQNGVASVLNDGREVIGSVPSGGLIPLFMTMGRLAEPGKFCAVLRDITQWKNAEEELVAARRAAETANQQKSDFLARISHEIRTPLNAVIGFSEVMLEERFGPIGSERYREYLKDIKLSGTHLMSLVNDLLDLSKIEAGKLDLAFSDVPVNEIIQECVALMQPEANRRRIIIRTSLAAAVPKVVADARSLRQIVLNLLSNSVKFTPAGGQVIVSTALDATGEVVIRVRDTGIGMSAQELETAMKPFRQVPQAGRARTEGTGLGLPLTKALVEANRASFAIDSAPNQGTLARITFPTTRVLPN